MLVEHTSLEHKTIMVVIGTTSVIFNEAYSNLDDPQGLQKKPIHEIFLFALMLIFRTNITTI